MNDTVRIIIAVLIAPFLAQALKLLWYKRQYHHVDFHVLFHDGGFPSSHSALVTALVTGVFYITGFDVLFVITAVFAVIVMRDATGIRRSAGQMAEVLNTLVHEHHLRKHKLKEVLGHTPLQVLAGSLLGLLVSVIIFTL